MKKQGFLAVGVAVGMLATAGVQVFAAGTVQQIAAYINDSFQFKVNGEAEVLDDEYHVLVYNDRSYLPVRALGDMLGSEIEWDDATKTISITNKSAATDDGNSDTSQGNAGNSGDNTGTTAPTVEYKALPQTYEVKDFRVDAESYYTDDYGDRLYLKIKNKEDSILRLVSAKTTYTINGKTYSIKNVTTGYWDTRWYTDYVKEDEELEGYLRLPRELDDEIGTLSVHVELQKDGSTETYPVDFNIKVK